MTRSTTLQKEYEDYESKNQLKAERYAPLLAQNVKRLLQESLAGSVSQDRAWRGLRANEIIRYDYCDVVERLAWGVIGKEEICINEERWFCLGRYFEKNFLPRCRATLPVLREAFAGDWNGLKDSTLKRRITAVHGKKIEDCDWSDYQSRFVAPEMNAVCWEGCWYSKEGLIALKRSRGAMLLEGARGSLDEVLSPYQGMSEYEAAKFARWAFTQSQSAKRDEDPVLNDRLLHLGEVLRDSPETSLSRVVIQVGDAYWTEDKQIYVVGSADFLEDTYYLNWFWRSQFSDFAGDFLADY